MAEGFGQWNGTRNGNADNPQKRDVQLMPPGSPDVPAFLVIEFVLDNPGVWPLHCHIAW